MKNNNPPPRSAPRVSIIVPVYNGATFIQTCLDSLLAQTLTDLEIIVVDDGSTDSTHAILSAYAIRDDRVLVLNQRNAGVSMARNLGLAYAHGDFVAFMDADDAAHPVMYEQLVLLAEACRLDIAVCNAWLVEEGGAPPKRCIATLPDCGVQSGADWLVQQVSLRALKHYIWCHLYRREFLVRQRVHFVSGLLHQDIVWTNQVMLGAERVAGVDRPLYLYRQRPGSLSKPMNSTRRLAVARNYLRVVLLLDGLAARAALSAAARAAVRFQAADEGLGIFHIARKLDDADRARLWGTLEEAGFMRMLWRNVQTFAQARRVVKRGAWLYRETLGRRLREQFTGFDRRTQLDEVPSQLGMD